MPRPIDQTRRKPILPSESIDFSEIAAGMRRRTMTVRLGDVVTAPNSFPLFRAGAEAPQITGCYVNPGNDMGHGVQNLNGTWIYTLTNATRSLNLNAQAASFSGVTLLATAYKQIPVNNGNSTLREGDTLQMQLTESGSAFTMDELTCVVEWQPTVDA